MESYIQTISSKPFNYEEKWHNEGSYYLRCLDIMMAKNDLLCRSKVFGKKLVVIFNNEVLENSEQPRRSTEVYVRSLKDWFNCKTIVCSNYTKQEIFAVLDGLEELDLTRYGSIFIVVLSHGHEAEAISATDGYYNVDEILAKLRTIGNLWLRRHSYLFCIAA